MWNMQIVVSLFVICSGIIITQGFQLPSNDSPLVGSNVVEDTCGNSNYFTIKERLLENYDSFEEFYRLFTFAISTSLPKHNRSNDSFYVLGSEQECVSLQNAVNNQGGVTCPGRPMLNRDVMRVPCVMKEIKCLCKNCLIPHSLQSRRNTNRCKPIYNYVPVMRQLTEGSDVWSYLLEPLAVGCTCSLRRSVHSSRF